MKFPRRWLKVRGEGHRGMEIQFGLARLASLTLPSAILDRSFYFSANSLNVFTRLLFLLLTPETGTNACGRRVYFALYIATLTEV
jgi:hypothetical protein